MLMKQMLRRASHLNQVVAKRPLPVLMAMTNQRYFSIARYHFDDKDWVPTETQVSHLIRLVNSNLVLVCRSRPPPTVPTPRS